VTDLAPWLEMEDDLDLWSHAVRGMHLWSLIRYPVLCTMSDPRLGYRELHRHPPPWKHLGPARWASLAATTLRWRRSAKRPNDALFFSAAWRRVPVGNGSTTVDRHHGAYYDLFKNPLIFEYALAGHQPAPDGRYADRMLNADWLWAQNVAKANLVRLTRQECLQIEQFGTFVRREFKLDVNPQRWARQIQFLLKRCLVIEPWIKRHLPHRIPSKIAFVTEATSVQSPKPAIVRALRTVGFRVFEVQHGMLQLGHGAHNFSDAVIANKNHPCRMYLPDQMLTYSQWWHSQARLPIPSCPVGCPFLDQMVEQTEAAIPSEPKRILLIMGDHVIQRMTPLAEDLSTRLPDYKIDLKRHPNDRTDPAQYARLAARPNVEVTQIDNIYERLARSGIIVGGYLTSVLYEAVAYHGKRIFFFDGLGVHEDVGGSFATSEQLVQMIRDPNQGKPRFEPAAAWAPDWRHRIRQVLEHESQRHARLGQ